MRTLTAPPRRSLPADLRYGASLAVVVLAVAVTARFPALFEPLPFLVFFAAVLVATLVGGTGPGLLAVALSALAVTVLDLPWEAMLAGRDWIAVAQMGMFLTFATAISIAVGLRQSANRKLDLMRDWLGTTLNSIADGVVVTDEKGFIVFLNPVAAALAGWTLDEAVGKRAGRILPLRDEETLEWIENPVDTLLLTRKRRIVGQRAVLLSGSGKHVPIAVSAAAIRSGGLGVRGVVLVFRDVTSQRETEKALLQADRAKDQFLATLSHDLRAPLGAVLGWAQMLQEGDVDAESRTEGLRVIEQNTRAVAALIDDILDLTRIASGKIVLDRVPLDLARLVEEAVRSLQPSLAAKRIELDLRLPPGELVVSADPKRVRQIVWNLTSNAVKFSPEGGRIEIELKDPGGVAELIVVDHGAGINPDALPSVFDRFRQAHGEASLRLGGLGLGLAIVKDLAELHGGTITAASRGPGTGATFTLRLPAASSPSGDASASERDSADVGRPMS